MKETDLSRTIAGSTKEIVAQVARQIKEALVVSSDSALVEGNRLDGGESAGINN